MAYIRSAGLRGLRAVVAELGGDAETYARMAGLPVEALDSDDVLVEDVALAALLELAAADRRCADLGLRVAARQDLTMLGSLALAIQHSPTVGDALECTTKYLFVHGRSLSLTLGPDPGGRADGAALYYRPCTTAGPVQGTDLALGFIHRAMRYLHQGDYGLYGVALPYAPAAPPERYQEFFGAPVRFRQPLQAALLRVPRSLLDREIAGVNETLRRLALAFLAEQAPGAATRDPRSRAELVTRVRAVVDGSLGTRNADVAAVAGQLGLHPRTLQRRLEAHGTTFAAIVDEARRDTAYRLVTTTDLSLGQVAGMVGFAEQSALSRAARRWWGRSARAVRSEADAEAWTTDRQ
jgi:AraC-like DNA-binding protein